MIQMFVQNGFSFREIQNATGYAADSSCFIVVNQLVRNRLRGRQRRCVDK